MASKGILINTTFANRDIQRMRVAKVAVEDANRMYGELLSQVESTFKGEAANGLIEVINQRIKDGNVIIENLETNIKNLTTVINKAVEQDKKIQEKINNAFN